MKKIITVTYEELRRFVRYEISFTVLSHGEFSPREFRCEKPFTVTPEDFISALHKAEKVTFPQFREEWYEPIYAAYESGAVRFGYIGDDVTGIDGYRYLPDESWYVWNVFDDLDCAVYEGKPDFYSLIAQLNEVVEMRGIPVNERDYDDGIKETYIKLFDRNGSLKDASENEKELFVKYCDELCARGNKIALRTKAYSMYGGNEVYPCDWVSARDIFLQLLDDGEETPFIANSLGYIYYYGRCSDGVPDYQNAFKYFSIGAAGGVYESRYKIADMFMNGYFVPKNEHISANIIWDEYYESLSYILDSDTDCKMADAALRVAKLFNDGIGVMANKNSAFYYLLQAQFAINERMKLNDYYGDKKVAANIQKAIDEVLPYTSYYKPEYSVKASTLNQIFYNSFKRDRNIEMQIKPLRNNEYILNFKPSKREDEEETRRFFITLPSAHLCGYMDNVVVKMTDVEEFSVGGKEPREETVIFDKIDFDNLMLDGKTVAKISGTFEIVLPISSQSVVEH